MKLRTVRRAAQRVNIRNVGVENAVSAKKVEWNRSVLHGFTHMEGAILYMRLPRGLVLAGYELGVWMESGSWCYS